MQRITSRQNPLVARFRAARAAGRGLIAARRRASGRRGARGRSSRIRQVAVVARRRWRGDDIRAHRGRASPARGSRRRRGVRGGDAGAQPGAIVEPDRRASAERPAADARHACYGARRRSSSSPCDVQDPGNVGAIVRVAEAGGATGVVAAGACADPFGWKALRGSMGSALRLPIVVRPGDGRMPSPTRGGTAAASWRPCRAAAGRCSSPTCAAASRSSSAAKARARPASLVDAADERVTIPMAAAGRVAQRRGGARR